MVVIFGLGFTGKRVAQRLIARGIPVVAPGRDADVSSIPTGALVVHTIPPLDPPENQALRQKITAAAPTRIVYISSTGVYGNQTTVDEHTQPAPEDLRGIRRFEEENWITAGAWSSLILRSAAIYGPGRGVHVAAREGRPPRGAGSGLVSRIHVDDLAALVDAGLFSTIEGAWPVADEKACPSDEIIRWCRQNWSWQNQPHGNAPDAYPDIGVAPQFTTGRQVDGSRIRRILGIDLIYPTWETGVPASLAEEAQTFVKSPSGVSS